MPRRSGRRRIALVAIAVAVVGAVAAIGLSGGFADAKTVVTPLAKAGEPVRGDLVEVTVHDAELVTRRPGDVDPAPAGRVYLVVHATVVDHDTESWVSRIGEVRATVAGLLDQSDQADVRDPRTGTSYIQFDPGVPRDVDYVWTVKSSAVHVGQKFWVGVYQRRHIQSDPVFGSSALTGPQAMAVVDLRMEDGS